MMKWPRRLSRARCTFLLPRNRFSSPLVSRAVHTARRSKTATTPTAMSETVKRRPAGLSGCTSPKPTVLRVDTVMYRASMNPKPSSTWNPTVAGGCSCRAATRRRVVEGRFPGVEDGGEVGDIGHQVTAVSVVGVSKLAEDVQDRRSGTAGPGRGDEVFRVTT